jgi:hypothetical protein
MEVGERSSNFPKENFELNVGLQLILDESNDLSSINKDNYSTDFVNK